MSYTIEWGNPPTIVPDWLDIYILLETIDPVSVQRFLDTYLSHALELADFYEFPAYGEATEFGTSDYRQMLDFLLARGGGYFRFYFRNRTSAVKTVMLFFNDDNTLTLGLTVPNEMGDQYTEKFTQQFPSPWVLCLYEVPPPSDAPKFKEWVEGDFDPFA